MCVCVTGNHDELLAFLLLLLCEKRLRDQIGGGNSTFLLPHPVPLVHETNRAISTGISLIILQVRPFAEYTDRQFLRDLADTWGVRGSAFRNFNVDFFLKVSFEHVRFFQGRNDIVCYYCSSKERDNSTVLPLQTTNPKPLPWTTQQRISGSKRHRRRRLKKSASAIERFATVQQRSAAAAFEEQRPLVQQTNNFTKFNKRVYILIGAPDDAITRRFGNIENSPTMLKHIYSNNIFPNIFRKDHQQPPQCDGFVFMGFGRFGLFRETGDDFPVRPASSRLLSPLRFISKTNARKFDVAIFGGFEIRSRRALVAPLMGGFKRSVAQWRVGFLRVSSRTRAEHRRSLPPPAIAIRRPLDGNRIRTRRAFGRFPYAATDKGAAVGWWLTNLFLLVQPGVETTEENNRESKFEISFEINWNLLYCAMIHCAASAKGVVGHSPRRRRATRTLALLQQQISTIRRAKQIRETNWG